MRLKCVPRPRKKRFFVISKRTRTLVLTDLDGALLDHDSYSWNAASPALDELRRQNIPLVFCTSKTRTEVKALRRAIGNTHPFIVENGGAIVIPAGYFPDIAPFGNKSKAFTMMIGRPYDDLVRELTRLSRDTKTAVRGFHQMTDDEVARETGLSLREAHMARQRETGEPFLFRNASASAIRNFSRKAQQRGYSVLRGGRFWHFSGGCDKGLALSVLIGFFRTAWQSRIVTVALGDSANDLPMFRLVDHPILIPKPDGSFPSEITSAVPTIGRAKAPGPEGWAAAVLQLIEPPRAGKAAGNPPTPRDSRLAAVARA